MTIGRTITVSIAAALLGGFATTAALAHAHLVKATPASGATIQPAPNEVTLRFNEKLEGAFSSVVVRDAAGKQVDKGDAHLDKADRATLRISLPQLTPGAYTVEWRAMSADTHKINGNFTFTVGE
jgi:methionine-rich copper-binding protein CopC